MWIFFLTAALVLLPSEALAFGPIAHVDLGLEVLARAALLGGGIGTLITRFREDFLLGTLAADRIVAKWAAADGQHTHDWNQVTSRLKATEDERERAFLLGYVCHLAADTVSHNVLVPSKMTESYGARMAGHGYWEMRFDSRVRSRYGTGRLRELARVTSGHARYLRTVLHDTIFRARVNYFLTEWAFRLQEGRPFAWASAHLDHGSRLAFSDAEVEEIYRLAIDAEIQALQGLDGAAVMRLDPRGQDATRLAKDYRRALRKMTREHRAPSETRATLHAALTFFRGQVAACLGG